MKEKLKCISGRKGLKLSTGRDWEEDGDLLHAVAALTLLMGVSK